MRIEVMASRRPGGVAIRVGEGDQWKAILLSPKVARTIADEILRAAMEVEFSGGASAYVE
jgi:hypothetical protein